jgi:hypothetical protein
MLFRREEAMSEQQYLSRAGQRRRRKSQGTVIFLLLCLLVVLVFAYSAVRLGNEGTSTTTEGQCLSNGKQFNGRQEAFLLAQKVEEYRAGHPFNGNYGAASYTLFYADGSQQRVPSPIAPGYDNTTDKTKPRNYTHSEQALYRWLQNQLAAISFDPQTLAGLYVIIFSQVRICDLCLSEMVSWQATLRHRARTNVLYLAIWEIQLGTPSAFSPTEQPKGTGTPVASADLRRVTVRFTP